MQSDDERKHDRGPGRAHPLPPHRYLVNCERDQVDLVRTELLAMDADAQVRLTIDPDRLDVTTTESRESRAGLRGVRNVTTL